MLLFLLQRHRSTSYFPINRLFHVFYINLDLILNSKQVYEGQSVFSSKLLALSLKTSCQRDFLQALLKQKSPRIWGFLSNKHTQERGLPGVIATNEGNFVAVV
jgi:hypothetical protein